jgi:hypothetical protein
MIIYGPVWYSYKLKFYFILESDCFDTTYARVVIVCTANAWFLRVMYFATSINVRCSALVTFSCGSETQLAGQVVTDVSTCGHMRKLVLNLCLERLDVLLRQTNQAVSTLHQREREREREREGEREWMR